MKSTAFFGSFLALDILFLSVFQFCKKFKAPAKLNLTAYPNMRKKPLSLEGVTNFVSLRFCFPIISSIGYCQNLQYLQGFVSSAHTWPSE